MSKNYLKLFKLILGKNSLLRALQIYECLNINLSGISLEFGAINDKNKTFSNYTKGKSKFHYSNKIINKRSNTFYSDLTKKIKVSTKTYENVLLFNVLEHLPEYKMTFSEIYRILKKGGNFIGSVSFYLSNTCCTK